MTVEESRQESFESFKNSFAYGARSDLNFKFLKNLSEQDAGEFFQGLLWKLGDSFDDGTYERLVEHVYEWQVRGYAGAGRWVYGEGPFMPLNRPVARARLALVTSSGHFVDGQDPEPLGEKHMTQAEAERRIDDFIKAAPQLTAIPFRTPHDKLNVRHGGYDVRGVQADPNVALPLEHLVVLQEEGVIGELAPNAYSFVGACAQSRLLKHEGPQWVSMLQQQHVDAALLVPV